MLTAVTISPTTTNGRVSRTIDKPLASRASTSLVSPSRATTRNMLMK